MRQLFLTFLLFTFNISFSQEEYTNNEVKFSVLFEGKPSVRPEGDITDVLYEAPNSSTTYIVSYKKEETNLTGKDYCNYLKDKIKNNDKLELSFSKIIEFNGLTALKFETILENKYNTFTYETIAFKLNGYEIELIAMSKEEDLDLRDLNKFTKSFKVIK